MDFYHKLLNYFSLDEEQYKNLVRPLSDADVPSPNRFDNMDEATERITKAIANDERIFIYGDYDCDGVLATAILVKTFQMMGYKNYGYYIPSRYIDGYAITLEKVRQAKEKGYSLIITVDNGITKTEEVALANELGMDVIITDHHEMAEILPDAIAVIHPKLSSSPEVVTSGATMSFFLATSLLKKVDHYLLSLAGISIISDLMELKGYNRDIVRLMINYVNNEHYDPIVLLCESSDIDENTIGSKFAPKVNAIGRLIEGTNINRLVKYFACDNKDELVSSAS
ncbi:MAG: DHH family phosphoesterase, partial [Bacilli bacterium]